MKKSVSTLKTYFETNDVPTQQQFWDWLDSFIHKDEGKVITTTETLPEGFKITYSDGSTSLIEAYQLQNQEISFINGLQAFIDSVNSFQSGHVLTENNFSNQNLQDLIDLKLAISSGNLTYLHSKQDLTKSNQLGEYRFGILDYYTGENVILKVTEETPLDIDSIIYFDIDGTIYKRIFDFVKPEWFGLGEGSHEIAINKAIKACDNVFFKENFVYNINEPIIVTKNKNLIGNNCEINSTYIGDIIKGDDTLLSGVYHHDNVKISDFKLKSSISITGLNLEGFKYSTISNVSIEFHETTAASVGFKLKHGTSPHAQCYFNKLENCRVYLDAAGTGFLIEGTIGTSGANCNTILGGSVGGYDDFAVVIKDNSVGNIIQGLDAEAFEQKTTEQTAFKVINSTQNTFIACHAETYKTGLKCDASSFANRFISFSHAALLLVSEDLGENIFEFVNSGGFYAQSVGKTNEGLTSGVQRFSSYVNSGLRLDTTNAFGTQKNVGIYNGVGGFIFKRSDAAGGDPLANGTTFLELNASGKFEFLNYIKITNILEYANNAAALGDGLTAGYVYRDATGHLKIVY